MKNLGRGHGSLETQGAARPPVSFGRAPGVTSTEDPSPFERGLGARIPVSYERQSKGRAHAPKKEALEGMRRLQRYIGILMISAAATAAYLLATDGSLWHLAVSHAVGLVMVALLDVSLGSMNLLGSKKVYVPSLAAAVLGIVLQLGDVTTAPQYNMTMAYFASYLFGLWAFDALVILQGLVVLLGVAGRSSVEALSRRSVGKELNYSRRTFLTTGAGFAALVGLGVALGSVKASPAAQPRSTTTAASVARTSTGAAAPTGIANVNTMQVDSPVYFEYPAGLPNVLFKRSDGTLAAYSMLCTHVCCEVNYEPASSMFYCPCHGSEFNSSGKVVRGPASAPLPSVQLTVDASGNVHATGVSGYTPC